jgi:hypothetical protein
MQGAASYFFSNPKDIHTASEQQQQRQRKHHYNLKKVNIGPYCRICIMHTAAYFSKNFQELSFGTS